MTPTAGQVDKNGEPYILHPIRVMLAMPSEVGRIVGVLHDVLKDSRRWSIEMIGTRGFATNVTETLRLLTREPGTEYTAYIDAIANSGDGVAREVKIQDILDNLRPERIRRLPIPDRRRLESRYLHALCLLDENMASLLMKGPFLGSEGLWP